MRIVREFFTSVNGRPFLPFITLLLVLSSLALFPQTTQLFGASLPRQIGRLNDYGNVLTMEDQKELEGKIESLAEEGIGLTVLVSRHDPYSDSSIYASEIRNEWGIRGKVDESLFVFVEEGDGWKVRTFLRPVVADLFSSGALAEYQNSLSEKTEDGDVREAVRESVTRIYREVFVSKEEPEGAETGDSTPLVLYLVMGGVGGLILLLAAIRWEAQRRCPRCGGRLEVIGSRGGPPGAATERHCPECGYHERG